MGVPKEINDISFKNWIDTEFDSKLNLINAIELEILALSLDSYLNVKTAFFKELQNYCKSIGIKFDNIKNYIIDEKIQKKQNKLNDLFALEYEIRKSNISTSILSATIRRLSDEE